MAASPSKNKRTKTPHILSTSSLGLKNDGTTLCTPQLQQAIDQLSKKGGGVLRFTPGQWLTGTLQLKTGVTLQLDSGAVVLGSTSPYDYVRLEPNGELQVNQDNFNDALIMGDGVERIAITGKGIIDGQGRKLALTIDSLHHTGEWPDPQYNTRRLRPNRRPKLIYLRGCHDIAIKDATLKSSAAWGLSLSQCSDIHFKGLTIVNRAYWNNDGIDLSDCQRAIVEDCDVDAADDGICLKSHHEGIGCDSIVIRRCNIVSSSNAVKFGTESRGGFRRVWVDSIRVWDTFRSAIAIESVDGAEVEDIHVNHVRAKNVGCAFFVRLGHRNGPKPGYLRHVTINDVEAEVAFGRPDEAYDLRGPEVNFFHNPFPASITGIPEARVQDVKVSNIRVSYPGRATKGMAYMPLWRIKDVPENKDGYPEFSMLGELPAWALYVRHVDGLALDNIQYMLRADDFRPAFVLDDVTGISRKNISVPKMNHDQWFLKDCKVEQ